MEKLLNKDIHQKLKDMQAENQRLEMRGTGGPG
jgi:hypothetical protein